MNADYVIVDQISLDHPGDRSRAIPHHHLFRFARSLRKMQIHQGVVPVRQIQRLMQYFFRNEVCPLRRKHDPDSTVVRPVPLIEYILCRRKGFFRILLVILIQLAGGIHPIECTANTNTDISSHADLLNKLARAIQCKAFFADRCCAVHYRFGNCKLASRPSCCRRCVRLKRSCAMHHPVANILCDSSHRAICGVHMPIDQPRQHQMRRRIERFHSCEFTLDLIPRCNLCDLPVYDGNGIIKMISDSIAFHRVHVMRMNNHICLFHLHSPLLFSMFPSYPIRSEMRCADRRASGSSSHVTSSLIRLDGATILKLPKTTPFFPKMGSPSALMASSSSLWLI